MIANTAPNYGKGEYTLPSETGALDTDQEQIRTWLEKWVARPGLALPRPPQVAFEVLALSHKPSARIEDIAALLEREPLLAGRVLKLANSALYTGAAPCVTLKQALVRVGLASVRDVVMEAAMQMTVIHAEGFNTTLERVRRHSSAVAWVSRLVARNTPFDAENAFLVGLIHDVGLSVALTGLAEYQRAQKLPAKLTAGGWLAVESLHERFSAIVLKTWGLPPQVTLVVEHHHTLMLGGVAHPQVAVLLVAEQIADDAGWGVRPVVEGGTQELEFASGVERSGMDGTDQALRALSLTRRHFATVMADATPVLEALAAQFGK